MSDWIESGQSGDTWKPENEGDSIIGRYIAKKENVGMNNSNIYMLKVEEKDEPTGVWGSTVLDSRFEEVKVGYDVKIEFLGHKKGNSPKPYKDFKVMYKKPEDWVADAQAQLSGE